MRLRASTRVRVGVLQVCCVDEDGGEGETEVKIEIECELQFPITHQSSFSLFVNACAFFLFNVCADVL